MTNWKPGDHARIKSGFKCLPGQDYLLALAGREVILTERLDPFSLILLAGVLPNEPWWIVNVINGPDCVGLGQSLLEPLLGPKAQEYLESLKNPSPSLEPLKL